VHLWLVPHQLTSIKSARLITTTLNHWTRRKIPGISKPEPKGEGTVWQRSLIRPSRSTNNLATRNEAEPRTRARQDGATSEAILREELAAPAAVLGYDYFPGASVCLVASRCTVTSTSFPTRRAPWSRTLFQVMP
jgi:hypothetical protein